METPAPHGSFARDFFSNILTNSPTNVGEQAEVANLIRLYVTATIKESTLRDHTVGTTHDEPLPQSFSLWKLEETRDTKDTGTYPGHTQMGTPASENPFP